MFPIVTTFLNSKYKHVIGYTLTVVACGLTVWYSCATIKDHYWEKYAAKQSTQIVQLQQKITNDDIKLAKLDTELTTAQASVEINKHVAEIAQAKVNKLLAKYEPTTVTNAQASTDNITPLLIVPTTFDNLSDCTKEVITLKADMGTMFDEIHKDRNLIASLETENDILEQKDITLSSQNDSLKQVITTQTTIIDSKDKQLEAEKTKTKFWKRIAQGAGIVIVALSL